MNIGKEVFLEGISLKGKNRCREHGHVWKIVDVWQKVSFSELPGPWLMVEAKDKHTRWVHPSQDKDFRVVALVDDEPK